MEGGKRLILALLISLSLPAVVYISRRVSVDPPSPTAMQVALEEYRLCIKKALVEYLEEYKDGKISEAELNNRIRQYISTNRVRIFGFIDQELDRASKESKVDGKMDRVKHSEAIRAIAEGI